MVTTSDLRNDQITAGDFNCRNVGGSSERWQPRQHQSRSGAAEAARHGQLYHQTPPICGLVPLPSLVWRS